MNNHGVGVAVRGTGPAMSGAPADTLYPVTSTRSTKPAPRERLLATATRLFSSDGIRAVGIDRILREAGVAKASLYNTYGSKDELVVAYLRSVADRDRELWQHRADRAADARGSAATGTWTGGCSDVRAAARGVSIRGTS